MKTLTASSVVSTICLALTTYMAGINNVWARSIPTPDSYPSEISLSAIPVCYDFGCKNQLRVYLSKNNWRSVAGWFFPPATTPAEERKQIKHAIGWMEVVIGWYAPTHKDLAFDLPPKGGDELFPGQLDCIDETINTSAYLRLFDQHGYLKHHDVVDPAYRRALFDQHWSAQVQEKLSGERFVVDSWFQPNGYLPTIQNSKEWEDINLLTAVVDNSTDEEQGEAKLSLWQRILRVD